MKTKIQLYGMAIFFFFFLYDSPAGLLFYWTLNNVFSLVKNIFYKLKNPGLILTWWLKKQLWTKQILPKIGHELTEDNIGSLKELIEECLHDKW